MEEAFSKTSIALAKLGEVLGIRNRDPESGRIFVTGGTGVIGHRVAIHLLRAGYPLVRLGSYKADSLEEENKLGAEIADFAWDREETYDKALDGVKSVVCTVAYTKDLQKHFSVFLKACARAGVRHFIKLSFYHARMPGDPFQDVPLVQAHRECDEYLIKSLRSMTFQDTFHNVLRGDSDVSIDFTFVQMSYTILYASHFMSNPFMFQGKELRDSSTLYGASGNHGVNYVSPNDVAEVAVRVLLEPRPHYNKEYTLTGPKAVTNKEVADLLSKHMKKPVTYVDQPLHKFTSELQLGGDPDWMVKDLAALEKIKATGLKEHASFLTDDIEKICGHQPENFEEYLQMTDMMTTMEMGAPRELKPLKEAPAVAD